MTERQNRENFLLLSEDALAQLRLEEEAIVEKGLMLERELPELGVIDSPAHVLVDVGVQVNRRLQHPFLGFLSLPS